MPGMNMFPSGSALQIPLDACTNFASKAGNAQIALTWTDPKDKYATPEGETAQDPDQLVSVWEYTQIIRKTGSQPTGPHDGELVVSSSVRDQYATTGFVDDGLTNDSLAYSDAVADSTDGVASEGAVVSATPQAGTPLGSLAEGTLITIKENGAPVEFYVAKINYEESLNGVGRILVVRKDNTGPTAWTSNYPSRTYYETSLLDDYCNSVYPRGFSSAVRNAMGRTAIDCMSGNLERAAFALSVDEYGLWKSGVPHEGTELPIGSVLAPSTGTGFLADKWTRTWAENNGAATQAYYISTDGSGAYARGQNGESGVQPAFTLPATALVDTNNALIET